MKDMEDIEEGMVVFLRLLLSEKSVKKNLKKREKRVEKILKQGLYSLRSKLEVSRFIVYFSHRKS